MVFQRLTGRQAGDVWRPLQDWVAAAPQDFAWKTPLGTLAAPARRLWDAKFLRVFGRGLVVADDRPGAPEGNVFWAGDQDQVGQFLHGYLSAWLPASLLTQDRQKDLAESPFAGSRHWTISLHFNKGLAGAPDK